jgi:hypothetical protein
VEQNHSPYGQDVKKKKEKTSERWRDQDSTIPFEGTANDLRSHTKPHLKVYTTSQ